MILDKSNGISPNTAPAWFSGFRFEMQQGLKTHYLHLCDLNKTTTDIRLAWVGPREKVKNVRRLYPHTKAMTIVKHQAKDTLRPLPSGY